MDALQKFVSKFVYKSTTVSSRAANSRSVHFMGTLSGHPLCIITPRSI